MGEITHDEALHALMLMGEKAGPSAQEAEATLLAYLIQHHHRPQAGEVRVVEVIDTNSTDEESGHDEYWLALPPNTQLAIVEPSPQPSQLAWAPDGTCTTSSTVPPREPSPHRPASKSLEELGLTPETTKMPRGAKYIDENEPSPGVTLGREVMEKVRLALSLADHVARNQHSRPDSVLFDDFKKASAEALALLPKDSPHA